MAVRALVKNAAELNQFATTFTMFATTLDKVVTEFTKAVTTFYAPAVFLRVFAGFRFLAGPASPAWSRICQKYDRESPVIFYQISSMIPPALNLGVRFPRLRSNSSL